MVVNKATCAGQRAGRHTRHALAWQARRARTSRCTSEAPHAKSGVVPHVQAAICINAALGGIIEFKVDGRGNVVGRIEVSRPMSEGGAGGRRLRHTGMLT